MHRNGYGDGWLHGVEACSVKLREESSNFDTDWDMLLCELPTEMLVAVEECRRMLTHKQDRGSKLSATIHRQH